MKIIPVLNDRLCLFLRNKFTVSELEGELLSLLPQYLDDSLKEELGLVGHFLAFVYEVQDGVTEEADLRLGIQKYLETPEKYISSLRPRRRRKDRTFRSFRPSLAQNRNFCRLGRPTRSSGTRRAARRYTDSIG